MNNPRASPSPALRNRDERDGDPDRPQSAIPDDIDAAIVGRTARRSCCCPTLRNQPNTLDDDNWTFDDSAPTTSPTTGRAGDFQTRASNRPTTRSQLDDLTPEGARRAISDSLSLLGGGSPNGAWNLFVFDEIQFHGSISRVGREPWRFSSAAQQLGDRAAGRPRSRSAREEVQEGPPEVPTEGEVAAS